MAFNYRDEKLKFDRKWAQLRKEYEAEGMPPKDIDEMYEFDCDWFRSRRRFENHTQELPAEQIDEDNESRSSLVNKFESMRHGNSIYFLPVRIYSSEGMERAA